MENPEGVGLITAMVVSGGFVLLSKLLDRTVTHLLNYKRRQNRCASRSIALAQPNSRPHPPPIVPTIHESSPSLMNPQGVLSNVDQAPTKFDAYLRRRHSEPAHGHDDRRIIDAVSSKYYHDIKEPCCLVKKYLDKVPNEKRLSRLRRHQRMKEERRSVPSLSDSARGHDSSAASATSSRPSARSWKGKVGEEARS